MDKKKIEIAITIILAVIFVFFLINIIKRISKRPKATPVAAKEIPITERQRPKTKDQRPKTEIFTPLVWGRDPFVLIERGFVRVETPIVLGGIICDRNQPKAMINDEVYKIGDKIGDIEIVDIKRNSVIIKEGDKTREISLY